MSGKINGLNLHKFVKISLLCNQCKNLIQFLFNSANNQKCVFLCVYVFMCGYVRVCMFEYKYDYVVGVYKLHEKKGDVWSSEWTFKTL